MNNIFIPPPLRSLKSKQKRRDGKKSFRLCDAGETILGIKNRAVSGRWKGFAKRICVGFMSWRSLDREWKRVHIVCSGGCRGLWRYCLHRWIKCTMDGHGKIMMLCMELFC